MKTQLVSKSRAIASSPGTTSSKARLSLLPALLATGLLLAAGASAHPRLKEQKPAGTREKLSLGTLFFPEKLPAKGAVGLLVHFHGPAWIAEVAGARAGMAALSVQLGIGSAVYGKPFADAKNFGQLLAEAEKKTGRSFEPIVLSAWSAGYGAVRAILRHEEYYRRVQWGVLFDGLHAGHPRGGEGTDRLVTADLDVFVKLARDDDAGRKRFLITHTRIVPSGYASTTECADYLIARAGLTRKKIDGKGLLELPLQSEARKEGLYVMGYAGTTAADHIDHLHGLPAVLAWWANK
jgi:hypothetical protein